MSSSITTVDDVVSAALSLPENQRLQVVARVMESLPDDFPGLSDDDAEFEAELDRRSGDWEGSIAWVDLRLEQDVAG
jgi:hypothetical protein